MYPFCPCPLQYILHRVAKVIKENMSLFCQFSKGFLSCFKYDNLFATKIFILAFSFAWSALSQVFSWLDSTHSDLRSNIILDHPFCA